MNHNLKEWPVCWLQCSSGWSRCRGCGCPGRRCTGCRRTTMTSKSLCSWTLGWTHSVSSWERSWLSPSCQALDSPWGCRWWPCLTRQRWWRAWQGARLACRMSTLTTRTRTSHAQFRDGRNQSYLIPSWDESSQPDGVDHALVLQPYHGPALGHLDCDAEGLLLICCLGNNPPVCTEDTPCLPGDGQCCFLIRDAGHTPSTGDRKAFLPSTMTDDDCHQHHSDLTSLHPAADCSSADN